MDEKKTTGFLEESPYIKSNSRLIGDIIILFALLLVCYVVMVGIYQGESIIIISASAGTMFTTIAGPAMFFIFKQKQTEDLKKITNDENKEGMG